MATLQGYTDGSFDYKQFYNVKDLRGPYPRRHINPNTILSVLETDGRAQQMLQLVRRLPAIESRLNNFLGSFTFFVPVGNIIVDVEDSFKVLQFLLLHTLEHPLDRKFLQASQGMFVNTMQSGRKILVENPRVGTGAGYTMLDRRAIILDEQVIGNGVVYFISASLVLDDDPLAM